MALIKSIKEAIHTTLTVVGIIRRTKNEALDIYKLVRTQDSDNDGIPDWQNIYMSLKHSWLLAEALLETIAAELKDGIGEERKHG